jgi:hypothetical protein
MVILLNCQWKILNYKLEGGYVTKEDFTQRVFLNEGKNLINYF